LVSNFLDGFLFFGEGESVGGSDGWSGYEGNSGADAVQESPTKPAKIQQIGAFELGRFWLVLHRV
jgi:hypothetical protein